MSRPQDSALRAFLRGEAAGGFVLIGAALFAMLIANLPATAALSEEARIPQPVAA